MTITEVAYLGPVGTYSHQVAIKRFGEKLKACPFSSITDICAYVSEDETRRAVVPVENS